MSVVHVVVPEGIDEAQRSSGGNHYDRRLCDELAGLGWRVREHQVPAPWPGPSDGAHLSRVLGGIADDEIVLVDGLIASAVPDGMARESGRLRLVVLVHMPLGLHDADGVVAERRALTAAEAVIATSAWTRTWLLERYRLASPSVFLARPGVDPADVAPGTGHGGRLLCVAAVTPGKGHDILLAALASLRDLAWECVCVGPLDRAVDFVDTLVRDGLPERVHLAGARTGAALDAAYAAADVLVLASRSETYGMVLTEALARGLPVIASDVGGVAEAVGDGGGVRPGLLVPPDDPQALAWALRRWLGDGALRSRLRRAAAQRREDLGTWSETATTLSGVLTRVAS